MSEQQDTDTIIQESVNTEQPGSGQADAGQANTEGAAADSTAPDSAAPKKGKGRKQSTARKTRSVELTLTVTGTAEGEWQAELTHAGKRVVQGLSIPASAVSKAASELHEDISEAIETVINDARQQHEAKLAELEAEMERVKKTLADLEN